MLHQIVVYAGEQHRLALSKATKSVGLLSRAGDLIVSVGDGQQDVEFDGKFLPAGHSVAGLAVDGNDPQIAVMLAGGDGIGMLQVIESDSEPQKPSAANDALPTV